MDMETLFNGIFFNAEKFFQSPLFAFLKIFLSIYALVLLADIILLIVAQIKNKDLIKDLRTTFMGAGIPVSSKNKMLKRWESVLERMRSGNISQYKVAIIEADNIANEILALVGYKGNNLAEKLVTANPDQLPNIEELKKSHEIRNLIVHEKDYPVDEESAKEAVKAYEKLLHDLEFV